MSRTWSPYQQNVFQFIESGTGNAVVNAVAGSGKSTTIEHGMKLVPEAVSTVFLAFNKPIADDLKERGLNAKTFHSMCYGVVTKHKNCRNMDTMKTRKIVDANLPGKEAFIYSQFICKLVGLAKQSGIGCLVPDVTDSWLDLVIQHDLEIDHEEGDIGRGIELASEVLTLCNASNMLDFDDLLYIAVKDGLPLPKYGFVFVDEAQDTNAIQRAILRKIMGPRSRLIAVGDPAQAIYGFRGADSNSLRILAEEFKCITLPLTVSYRCPESVISYARQWVSHIESAPGAEKGFVEELGTNWKPAILQANDLVVCRTTMPLIGLALKLMLARIPVSIMGRDIGQGLTRLIEKQKASNLDDLGDKLNVWRIRETEKALARMEEEKVETIEDKVSAIHCLIDGLNEDERTIAALLQLVEKMFSQGRNVVILATIHKSKGLEANRVFWLNRSKCPSKWAKQDWQKDQERNLCYVAATRAKKSLHIIEER